MQAIVNYLLATGKLAGLLAGIIAALGLIAKSPVGKMVRWVYVQLAGEPVGEWFRGQVRAAASDVVDEKLLKRNGGTTIPDVVARLDRLSGQVERNHGENEKNHAANSERLTAIESKMGDRP